MATGLDELCKAISASTEGHDALPRHSIHPTWGFQNDGLSVGSSSSHLPPSVPPSSGPSRRRMPSLRRSTPGIPSLIPSAPPAPRRTGQKRDWRPLGALPSMAMVEERTGSRAAQVRRNSGSAERELSHLYIENERHGSKTPERPRKTRKTWQSTVTKGLVDASVYSAVLGLTAYRLWRGDPKPPEAVTPATPVEDTNNPSLATSSLRPVRPDPAVQAPSSASPRARFTSMDHPPPAYEDFGSHEAGKEVHKDNQSIYEPDTPELRTPYHSHTSTMGNPHEFAIRYRKPQHRVRHPTHSGSSSLSHTLDFSPRNSLRSTLHIPDNSVEEDNARLAPDEQEINRQLDLMAFRLQDLVIEGQAALASQVHVVDVRDEPRSGRRRHLKTASSGVGLREREAISQRSSRSVNGGVRSRP